ncbi:hypothetical protein [Azospirillum picis]|uniref:Uncharacterized protein n=1 Tax=Azospirillum picis TaxID=488438 RepID=A0ABU0MKS3_9PROT|nr:hypothetical protein [Azospirillum picis]MBP2299909.1 hypothetical protein [Azospirillum picis]MDQ0533853.1 hypothetical protein [Azospirillum picis]
MSGQFAALLSNSPLAAGGKPGRPEDIGGALFKATNGKPGGRGSGPVDDVAFSKQALAMLKSGMGTPAAASGTSAGTSAGISAGTAPAQGAAPAGASTNAPADSRAQARPSDPPPWKMRVEGEIDLPRFDSNQSDDVIAYGSALMEHHRGRADYVRGEFGRLGGEDTDYGLVLSGDIAAAIDKTMALDGVALPQKPASLLAKEKEGDAGPPAMPEGTANTSMITLALPNGQKDGYDQIEIMFDDRMMDKLAGMSAEDVKAGMVDMLAGSGRGAAGNEAMKGGMMGKFIEENAAWHPEYAKSQARYGLFDPDQGTDRQPLMMIQSQTRSGYVREHVGELVEAVMGLLRGLAPGTPAATPATAPAAG